MTDGMTTQGTWYPVVVYPFIQSGQFVQVTWAWKSINVIELIIKESKEIEYQNKEQE